jgi:hypothetical protein
VFYLACRYTYEATKSVVVILVLAVFAYSYHAGVDRTRFAELVALAEVAPMREVCAWCMCEFYEFCTSWRNGERTYV